jgi:hypothetical protein
MLSNLGVIGLLPVLIVLVIIGVVISAFLQIRTSTRETSEKLDAVLNILTEIREQNAKR